MLHAPRPLPLAQPSAEQAHALERAVAAVEDGLAALSQSLTLRDPEATEQAAAALHQTLAEAMDRFAEVARHGGVPPALRRRLARSGGQVAAQRNAVARGSQWLDRTLELLIGPAATEAAEAPPAARGGFGGASPFGSGPRSSGWAQA
ncbi:hypothetical protein [Ideonella livida]|uniref:Flagellar protein FlgN n=1 Tax=Ideonella livida TaxID=2707176 RepID=A0A7C9TPL7_9BURK|nr:hypothetical protein [Ideonella livida]NDY94026.1 hypothetical protein [Ideonella livida]